MRREARRSQRQIDFWPTRPALLAKALARAPKTLADMESVGTPAKGFPAMEQLLAAPPSPAHCPYLVLVAEGIEAEAVALRTGFDALAARDWTSDEDAARSAFAPPTKMESGGGGLLSTMHDYMRFCRMLLNGGELDGVRLLSPKTVTLFSTNLLPDGRDAASPPPVAF